MTEIQSVIKLSEVRHLLTYNCMLKCKHCYLSAGTHSVQPVHLTRKDLNNFYHYFKPDTVSATGGEPLLRRYEVEHLAASLQEYGGALKLVTNGMLLNLETIKKLNDLNEKTFYQISLDGTAIYHDELRKQVGAFSIALMAIKNVANTGRVVKVRMTVTSENYNQIPDIIKLLDYIERPNIHLIMRPVISMGRAKENKLQLERDKFKRLDYFASLAKNIYVETTDNNGKCGCGVDTIAIDPSGTIFPCTYFVFKPEYAMGNMFTKFADIQEHKEFKEFTGTCLARKMQTQKEINNFSTTNLQMPITP